MTEQADHTATRYLLGVMSEDQRDAFELRILSDPDLSEIVADAESDLLDAYVRGELSDEERRLVREHLLVTDAQQARLENARALQGRLQHSERHPARWWWALAAAAAVAAIALFTFLPRRNTPR